MVKKNKMISSERAYFKTYNPPFQCFQNLSNICKYSSLFIRSKNIEKQLWRRICLKKHHGSPSIVIIDMHTEIKIIGNTQKCNNGLCQASVSMIETDICQFSYQLTEIHGGTYFLIDIFFQVYCEWRVNSTIF